MASFFQSYSQNTDVRAKRVTADSIEAIPRDTVRSAPNGSIAYKNGVFYKKYAYWKVFTSVDEWFNIKMAGADHTGVSDASSIIQTAINAGKKYIYLPRGTYLLSSQIQMKDSVTIKGDGPYTIVKLTSNISAFRMSYSGGGHHCQFLDFVIKGTFGTGTTAQQGIFIDSASSVFIHNVGGEQLAGFLIRSRYSVSCCAGGYVTAATGGGSIISNCYNQLGYGGVAIDTASEYTTVTDCNFVSSTYGIFVAGGNNRITDNNLSANTYGFYLTGGFNNGHGVASNNIINHSVVTNVYITGVNLGFSFLNNMIYAAGAYQVEIRNSDRINFVGGDIVSSAAILDSNSTKVTFVNVNMRVTGAWSITGEAPTVYTTGATGYTLWDVVNNKKFDFGFTNNIATIDTLSTAANMTNRKVMVHNLTTGAWEEIVKDSIGTGGGSVNIYNTDGTLTGSRILNAVGNGLQMIGIGAAIFSADTWAINGGTSITLHGTDLLTLSSNDTVRFTADGGYKYIDTKRPARITDTTGQDVQVINANGIIRRIPSGLYGGGGTPGGSNMQFQYNNSGVFGGVAGATFNGANVLIPTLYGEDANNGDLRLNGTSSSTKTTSYLTLQEAGGLVGIGQTTPTSKLHFNSNNIGTSQSDALGILLANSQPATVGAQQYSPATIWQGNGWKTDATAASQDVRFRAYVVPVQGTANPSGVWGLYSNINNAGFNERFGVNSFGAVRLSGNEGAAGQVFTSNGFNAAATWETPSGSGWDLNGTNTGYHKMGLSSSNSIAFVTNATVRMMIDSVQPIVMINTVSAPYLSSYGDVKLVVENGAIAQTYGGALNSYWYPDGGNSRFIMRNSSASNKVSLNTSGDSFFDGGSLGIGTASPNASALLDITSTTKGLLLPRMTKAQRDAISSPAAGLAVYQTDNTPGLRVYNGTNWMRFTETAD